MAELDKLGKQIASIVRDAIGALNHTHIGYSSEHDALADPYIDDILKVVEAHTTAQVDAARNGAFHEAINIVADSRNVSSKTDREKTCLELDRIAHLTTGQKEAE